MIINPNISALYAFLAAGYENLFRRAIAVDNELAFRELAVVGATWRNRHRVSSSEFPTAPILPRYQY
jgi:hypothetical protein